MKVLERWDAYDSYFNRIKNMVLVRGESIPDGFFHLICEVIVKHMDGTYLLMKRALNKRFGDMWEGSALQGENPLECAIRELQEETGIIAENLMEIGQVVDNDTRSIYVEFLYVQTVIRKVSFYRKAKHLIING